jgi:fluoroacetyl-CoA thioesterase
MDPIAPGLRHVETLVVDRRLTVPEIPGIGDFSDMPPVLATAYMIAFVEWTCVQALRPHLAPTQRTVGTHVDLSHSAATPVGMRVTAEVELVEVDGRRLRFRVVCRDERGVIGQGHHERHVIDFARFLDRLATKAAPKP